MHYQLSATRIILRSWQLQSNTILVVGSIVGGTARLELAKVRVVATAGSRMRPLCVLSLPYTYSIGGRPANATININNHIYSIFHIRYSMFAQVDGSLVVQTPGGRALLPVDAFVSVVDGG